jgi:nicotinamidase-related amidase
MTETAATAADPAHIVGAPVLIVVDIQGGAGQTPPDQAAIPVLMTGREERRGRVRRLIDRCREAGIPVVWIQEVHKRSLIDIGRELDGAEGPHCIEGDPTTELATGLEPRPEEFLIRKRRYSAFFATELDLVLRAYGTRTVILVGGLTDVCIHYTAVDAHQHDYVIRVASDAVGGSSVEAHDAALRAMQYLQRDALATTDELRALMTPTTSPSVGVASPGDATPA